MDAERARPVADTRAGSRGVLLRCEGLAKSFGARMGIEDVSFTVARGETYGLLGPNGAGKTTTIKIVCGLLAPDRGAVTLAGRRIADDLETRRLVGYVPQEVALYPDLSARENLRFLGRLYGLRGATLQARVEDALELIGLTERAGGRVEAFSGGMKRRLNIAAGLLHQPSLLVLDEPTVGVDPQSRHAILERVRSFSNAGMAVLYTTHYMEEAERVCDRVGIVDRGRLVAEGTRRELVAQLGERDRIDLAATGDLERFAALCKQLAGVEEAAVADASVHVLARDGRRLLPSVLELAERAGASVNSVQVREADLEAVFLHLTGTALRE